MTCRCGCGRPVSILTRTRPSRGQTKGEFASYIKGHGSKTGRSKKYFHRKSDRGLIGAHVAIAERALGRPLPIGAHVHHVDGNKQNNAHANLVVCQDAAYHRLLHVRQRVLDAGGDPNKHRICSTCKRLTVVAELVGRRFRASNYCLECQRKRSAILRNKRDSEAA